MTRRPSFRPTTASKVVLAVMASVLCATATPAAMDTVTWATATGSSPAHFENHEMGYDDVMGPNQSYAVGRWGGPVRHGSYSGFNLPTQAWVPTLVQVTLAGYVTGTLQNEYLRVTLVTTAGKYGPVTLGAASLNENVGASGAGTWVMDFSSFFTFPAGALQGAVDVEIKLMSQGPSGGHELHLDAIGMMVRLADPNQSFDLWLGDHAPALAGGPSYLQGIGAPLDLGNNDCAGPICYLLVRDVAGEGRTVSVLLLADGTTFRVGFEGGPLSTPVDAVLSQVAAPATASADNVTLVQVEVTPRDSDGLPFGEGVTLSLDPDQLGPAAAVGGFTHTGDGTFVIELTAGSPGDATLVVQADGVTLSQAPVVSFLAP